MNRSASRHCCNQKETPCITKAKSLCGLRRYFSERHFALGCAYAALCLFADEALPEFFHTALARKDPQNQKPQT
jgi:hypothetical protein